MFLNFYGALSETILHQSFKDNFLACYKLACLNIENIVSKFPLFYNKAETYTTVFIIFEVLTSLQCSL